MSTKDKAIGALQDLPEDASWTDIEERIRFLAALEKGRQEVRSGKTVAHQEVKDALAGWITP